MKYRLLALTALFLPPQAMMVQDWTPTDTGITDPTKAKLRAIKGDTVDMLVGDYDLASGEFVRIELKKGQVYRVEFSGRGGSLQIRPRLGSHQAALPMIIEDIPHASSTPGPGDRPPAGRASTTSG